MSLGKALKEFRKENNLTLTDVSMSTGLNLCTLSNLENSKKGISKKSEDKIKEFLDTSAKQLIDNLNLKKKQIAEKIKLEEELRIKEQQRIKELEAKYKIIKDVRFIIPSENINKIFIDEFRVPANEKIYIGSILNIKEWKLSSNKKNIDIKGDMKAIVIDNENYNSNWYKEWKGKYFNE